MEKKNRFKPVQPYLLIDTDEYVQVMSSFPEISHFYLFSVKDDTTLRIVPDGSVDIIFVHRDSSIFVYLVNAKLRYKELAVLEKGVIFGVRFMPAVLPKIILNMKNRSVFTMEEYVATSSLDHKMLYAMSEAEDIYEKISVFCEWYESIGSTECIEADKRHLLFELRKEIIKSDGAIRISELGNRVGYSERYINKIFSSCYGYSPKTLCKVIQFQKALEYLDYGYPENMTEAAVSLGYYDQSQFIKDFTAYANATPKKYFEMMEQYNFKHVMKKSTREAMV